MKKRIVIIGAGFSSLSAACHLQRAGFEVTIIEKHHTAGGRARQFVRDGFTFDMGPSWYWMPDIFESFFEQFGKRSSDFYELYRLDPSYQIFWEDNTAWDIPAHYDELRALLEKEEKGSGLHFDKVMKEAKIKYEVAVNQGAVQMEGLSVMEFLKPSILKNVLKFDLFSSVHHHIARHFRSPKIQKLMEFPVIFLGATAHRIPALYTLMNYADICLGTWHPKGGMFKVVEAMHSLASGLGVQFVFGQEVDRIEVEGSKARAVYTHQGNRFIADIVLSGADYEHTERMLLPADKRNYTENYWKKKQFAPAATLFYIALDKKLERLRHHNLFFDADFDGFSDDLYAYERWSENPLFYMNVPSISDASMAPQGKEAVTVLVPVPAGIDGDTEEQRNIYFDAIIKRWEERTNQDIAHHILFKETFGLTDFEQAYNSYKGNAYGLANTLLQTAHLKPKCRNKHITNLFYTGQLTIPGPGVPPAILSGEILAKLITRSFK